MNKPVVTRMPPSPTGHLHIGTARTALFNYLFAKQHGGKMILRSEDTDKARSTKEFETEIIEGLRWLGITWDNEEIYRQSERADLYKRYIEKALAEDKFFISKEPSKQDPEKMVEVVRLRNPNKVITFTDLIRGEITFDTTELGDIVVARSVDDALYHLTVVIDDFEMGVTHVLRGEDHIPNTPRQILIQEAIGAPRPEYAHLPLILASDRSKMSKRHGAVAVNEYKNEGFLKGAILNYLALLGWNPGDEREIFTLQELETIFSLDHVQKSGAIFDRQKFLWVNKEHLQKLSTEEFAEMTSNALPEQVKSLPQFSNERLLRLLPTIRERVSIAREITETAEAGEYNFAFTHPEVNLELIAWKNDTDITAVLPRLKKLIHLLSVADFSSPETIKTAVWSYAEEEGKGEVLWPLRTTLSGLERSPDPFTCAFIIGQEDTLHRLQQVCDKIVG